ncbi:MAG: hypothetical protein LBT12_05450 [Oscillospiraceae bacterium]|jgi:hypothetical protein|nr:hypothetical protein [Oscillospiraceae bacterium]
MTTTKTLIPVRYSDAANGIHLTNYADTVVCDVTGKRAALCAIRFGGYPEQVEAMVQILNGGGTVEMELEDNTVLLSPIAHQYRKKVSHDGLYAEAALFADDDKKQADENKKAQKPDAGGDSEQTEFRDLPPRRAYIYVPVGDKTALYDAIDGKTAVPLIPAFADYLIETLTRNGDLKPLHILSASVKFEAWVLKCDSGDKNIVKVVTDGLRAGQIRIPGANGAPMADVNTVTEYLTAFGPNIAERIKKSFVPLFDPGADTLSPEVLAVNETIEKKAGYSLYDAQLAVAEAIKRQLARRKPSRSRCLTPPRTAAGSLRSSISRIRASIGRICFYPAGTTLRICSQRRRPSSAAARTLRRRLRKPCASLNRSGSRTRILYSLRTACARCRTRSGRNSRRRGRRTGSRSRGFCST